MQMMNDSMEKLLTDHRVDILSQFKGVMQSDRSLMIEDSLKKSCISDKHQTAGGILLNEEQVH